MPRFIYEIDPKRATRKTSLFVAKAVKRQINK